jgi:hypothetical protein
MRRVDLDAFGVTEVTYIVGARVSVLAATWPIL